MHDLHVLLFQTGTQHFATQSNANLSCMAWRRYSWCELYLKWSFSFSSTCFCDRYVAFSTMRAETDTGTLFHGYFGHSKVNHMAPLNLPFGHQLEVFVRQFLWYNTHTCRLLEFM